MNEMKLPVPTQEKVGRWATWAIIAAVVVSVGNVVVPHMSTFAWNVAELAKNGMYALFMGVGLLISIFLLLNFAPIFVQGVHAFARRSAWALVEMSPTIHLELALDEVNEDVSSFGTFLGKIEEVKAQTEERRDKATERAQKAQNLYDSAMNKLAGQGLDQIQRIELEAGKTSFARERGVWAEAAKKFDASAQRLEVQLIQNTRLFQVFKTEAKNMEVDIQVQMQQWEQSQAESGIMDLAEKLLLKKSSRQRYAEMAEQVIQQRYAGNIGRMRNLKRLAQDSFNKFDLESGVFDQLAYENWQKPTTQVIDNNSGRLEAVPVARVQSAKSIAF